MPVTPLSPDYRRSLEGYAAEVSLLAGDPLHLMLSGAGDAEMSITRLIHGDPHPQGPGRREQDVDWGGPRALALRPQALHLGSYLAIPHRAGLNPVGSVSLALWAYPTLLTGEWQTLAAQWGRDDVGFGLFCVGRRMLVAAISLDGRTVHWCTGKQFLIPDTWQFLALTFAADRGELAVYQYLPQTADNVEAAFSTEGLDIVETRKPIPAGTVHPSRAPLWFGALPEPDGDGHWACYDGKLAAPCLVGAALDRPALHRLAGDGVGGVDGPILGAWDLSREVCGSRIIDVSGHEHHGVARNRPARAVTGPHWAGERGDVYADSPRTYDAIHLHSDDLDDAGWERSATVEVPADTPPGIYAAHVVADDDRITLPFVVQARTPTAALGVLLPTLTWQAYGSNRAPYSYTEDGVVDRAHCLYDVHRDGSMVLYCTRRKPTRSGDPSEALHQWGAHTIAANLYFVDWLAQRDETYDVLTDEALHHRGVDALAPFRCVVVGSHPEYWTKAMLDALEGYLAGGGRVMYLAGNGLYWVTSLDPEQPWVMEVRKSGDGDYREYFATPGPGEEMHSTSLEAGGDWARRGFPARRLVGVEHSANSFEPADGRWGFARVPASYEPRYAFVFDGVTEEVVGRFGLNLGSAAGYEMDSVLEWSWSPDWTPVVLARAEHEAFQSRMTLPVRTRGELALTASPGGAAVFAAGSVTWTGSLSHNAYDNDVARITANVLERFLSVPAGQSVAP